MKFYFSINNDYSVNKIVSLGVDIIEPKFSINNKNKKISITAKEGNFVNNSKILLKKNVLFKSEDFIIETENVFFDRENLTAYTDNESKFTSKKTTILSTGFNIEDNGNKISFNGKSRVIIK